MDARAGGPMHRTAPERHAARNLWVAICACHVSNVFPTDSIPVTGVAASNQLTLEGTVMGFQSGVDADVVRLTLWSTTRDEVGRMNGTFSYRRETHWTPPYPSIPVYTVDFDAELVGVVLEQ